MSKFNKIYEFEYNLFGQVSECSEIIGHVHMSVLFVFYFVSAVSRM